MSFFGSPPAWSLTAAREAAAEYRREIDTGGDPLADLTAGREAPTMRELASRFEREHVVALQPKTGHEYRALIASDILPALGSLKVVEVTYSDIARLHRRVTERAPYRANRCVALLSKMFALAIRWKMRPDNPVKGIERNHEERRARYLSPSELTALVAALDTHGGTSIRDF